MVSVETSFTHVDAFTDYAPANAVALYPDLVKDHPDYSSTGQVDSKKVFQVLIIREQSAWIGLLVHGVPRVRHTLVRTKPSHTSAEKCLVRLMDTTADLLGMRYPAELGIPSRKELKTQDGAADRDFL